MLECTVRLDESPLSLFAKAVEDRPAAAFSQVDLHVADVLLELRDALFDRPE